MPQLHELDATLVALPRILKNLVGLHVQEAQPHGPLAHDALQMADAAAAAISFAGIERHHYVTAFPNSVAARIDSKSDAIAERPDADKAIQISVRRRQTSGQNVGVVINVDRSGDAAIAQGLANQVLHVRAF